ncbi:MAG: hypothetical protein R6U27_11070 [Desulfobacterales bacterium]
MKSFDDLSDMLVEEVMSDMAGSFFGARVEIDDMVELFEEFVKVLEKKKDAVSLRAGLLNTLLIDSTTAETFYSLLKADPGNLLDKKTYSKDVLPEKMPLGLTEKSVFTKLFLFAYESLQKACSAYVRGNNVMGYDEKDEQKFSVNYAMLVHMCRIINEKIKKVNKRSAVCTLQYTRQFKPETIEKENITGGGLSDLGCEDLDHKMKFKPLDFESYNIERYPELPKLDQVKSDIISFARQVYAGKTSSAKKVMSDIRFKIKG